MLTVITCPCGNAKPHRKFQSSTLGKSIGIFSLAQGRSILQAAKAKGHVSADEVTAAEAALAAAGLPEFAEFTDEELRAWASELFAVSPQALEESIKMNLDEGMISPADAERLRVMVNELAAPVLA